MNRENRDPNIMDPKPLDARGFDPAYRASDASPGLSGGVILSVALAAAVAAGAVWYAVTLPTKTTYNPPTSTVGQSTQPMAPVIDAMSPAQITAPAPQPLPMPTPDPAPPINIAPNP
jgi:hypothetical protein